MKFLGYQCSMCGELYSPTDVAYTCPDDGSNLDVRIDYASIQKTVSVESISSEREGSIWRYLPLLPVGNPGHRGTQLWAVGWTPASSTGPFPSRSKPTSSSRDIEPILGGRSPSSRQRGYHRPRKHSPEWRHIRQRKGYQPHGRYWRHSGKRQRRF